MKKLLLVLLLLPMFSFAQKYSDVIEIPGKSAEQLYSTAHEWFALKFNSANDVIQLKDPEEKKLIGKGIHPVSYQIKKHTIVLNMGFTLFVQFKDGRYKYEIESNEITNSFGTKSTYEQYKTLQTQEAFDAYYKSIGTRAWVVGKKQIQKNIENNKIAAAALENQLKAVVDDLTATLKKGTGSDNW